MSTENKMREALERIAAWDEHDLDLAVNFGSNGVRDYYRAIAREALEQHPAAAVEHASAVVPEKAQWWLAEVDSYGTGWLSDGPHQDRQGANQAFCLINAINLSPGKKWAVARVELSDPVTDSRGVNHEAVATINSASALLAANKPEVKS